MDDKVLFFGYGANRSRSKITQIIGHDPGEAVGAITEDFTLGIQTLNQVPSQLHQLLSNVYGQSFKAYTLTPGEGSVSGVVWSLSKDDFEKIKQWEFVGIWREIIEITVATSKGEMVKVYTEKSMDHFPISETVDGAIYNEFNFRPQDVKNPQQDFYTQKQLGLLNKWIEEQINLEKMNRVETTSPQPSKNQPVAQFKLND